MYTGMVYSKKKHNLFLQLIEPIPYERKSNQ